MLAGSFLESQRPTSFRGPPVVWVQVLAEEVSIVKGDNGGAKLSTFWVVSLFFVGDK